MTPVSRRTALLVAVGMLLAAAPAAADSSINCQGGIVQVGDTKVDLLAKCGRPALEELSAQAATLVETIEGERAGTAGTSGERWTYNFGPAQFLRVVTLDLGRVTAIERGGYGYPPELLREGAAGRARCDSSAIRVGDRKLDLLARCGPPMARDYRREKRAPVPPAGAFATSPVALFHVDVETWTYDFGPRQFTALVVLENGTIVGVERGSYGRAK
jgi:hypothetical protein